MKIQDRLQQQQPPLASANSADRGSATPSPMMPPPQQLVTADPQSQSQSQPLPSSAGAHHVQSHAPSQSQPQPRSQPHSQPQAPLQPSSSLSTYHPPSQPANGPSSQSVYRQYAELAPRPTNQNGMSIYSAVYSGSNVYEMDVNGVAIMRRVSDDWLNATQILKIAGVEKGRRTKILEKEIQAGKHEKVQGGYGKYQGTWIPFDRGYDLCRQFHVDGLLHRLLTHNMRPDGEQSQDVDTPTKEQAMAAQRKRMYSATGLESRPQGPGGTFFRSISSTAHTALSAISKARFDSPTPKGRSLARTPSFNRQASMQSTTDKFPGNSQQSASEYSRSHGDPAYSSQTGPPRKRQRVLTPAASFTNGNGGYASGTSSFYGPFPGSPTEPNESFIYSQAGLDASSGEYDDGLHPLRPLPFEQSDVAEARRSMLMGFFRDTSVEDPAHFDQLRTLTPQELDLPFDAQQHTALHWAAALSRTTLLRALIQAGASPFRVNQSGETALMRACGVTNSADLNSFPELLDLLGDTIHVPDDKGRTVLHHIAVTSGVKGRHDASRYYLESLLEWVVRQGSAPSSQATGNGASSSSTSLGGPVNGAATKPERMEIGRFMSEIVNIQDKSGDTALNIAARIGNRSMISQLVEVGADPHIANKGGLAPKDFNVDIDTADESGIGVAGTSAEKSGSSAGASSQKSKESSDDIVNAIAHMLGQASSVFQNEMQTKKQSVEALHASLRTTSAQLGEAKRALAAAQERLRAQQLSRQRLFNLRRTCQDEEYRLLQMEQSTGQLDMTRTNMWESAAEAAAAAREAGAVPATGFKDWSFGQKLLQMATAKARIKAMRTLQAGTRLGTADLLKSSREVELKYKHLVALCTGRSEQEVDTLIEGLTRAVESEKGDLDIGRIRRFLGGVDSVAH